VGVKVDLQFADEKHLLSYSMHAFAYYYTIARLGRTRSLWQRLVLLVIFVSSLASRASMIKNSIISSSCAAAAEERNLVLIDYYYY
jgi:hypothetical protein